MQTLTAENVPGHHTCRTCGAGSPKEKLWALDRHGITTSETANIAAWICAACFAYVRPATTKPASSPPHDSHLTTPTTRA